MENFLYYGIVFLVPYWLNLIEESSNTNHKKKNSIDLIALLIPFLLEIPAAIFSFILIENPNFGRKKTIIYAFLFTALFCIGGYYSRN